MVCQSGFPCTSDSTCALLLQDFLDELVKLEDEGFDIGAVGSVSKKQKTQTQGCPEKIAAQKQAWFAKVEAHKSASEPQAWYGKIPAGSSKSRAAASSSGLKVETFFDPPAPATFFDPTAAKVETFFDPYQDDSLVQCHTPEDDSPGPEPEQSPSDALETT